MKNINIFSKNKSMFILVTIFIVTISFTLLNCNSHKTSKIPVTTSSEKALEYYNEGLLLTEKLRPHEAAYFYLKAISEDKEFALAYLHMAQIQTTHKLTNKYLTKAKSLINNISEGEQILILALEAAVNNEYEKQNDYYQELVEKYPNDELSHNIYGHFLFNWQKYKKAIAHYEIALEINPEYSQPYNMLGYAYRNLGDFQKAETYFKKYINVISNDPNPYDSYAELLLKMGKFESSIEYYRKALEIKSDFIPSIIGIASNLILLDKHEEACNELETITSITDDPGYLKLMHFAKAITNIDLGNFERALKEIQTNISISDSIKDYWATGQNIINLGHLYLMQENYTEALKFYEKSIDYFEKANVSQDMKYYMRRQLFVNTSRLAYYSEDLNTLKMYTEKYKSSAQETMNPNELRNTHELSGYIYFLEKDYYNAIYEFKQANQESPVILYFIGTAYEELGDIDKAQEIYESVAHFNALNSMAYAFIRKTALAKLDDF